MGKDKDVRIDFVHRSGGPENLLCEAEVVFEEGLLAGMKLVGFSVWRGPEDKEPYVTFPSRAFGLGAERRFFDYLRSADGDPKVVKRVKAAIVEAYLTATREGGRS